MLGHLQEKILLLIYERGKMNTGEISEALSIPVGNASKALRKLLNKGFLTRKRVGRRYVYFITADGKIKAEELISKGRDTKCTRKRIVEIKCLHSPRKNDRIIQFIQDENTNYIILECERTESFRPDILYISEKYPSWNIFLSVFLPISDELFIVREINRIMHSLGIPLDFKSIERNKPTVLSKVIPKNVMILWVVENINFSLVNFALEYINKISKGFRYADGLFKSIFIVKSEIPRCYSSLLLEQFENKIFEAIIDKRVLDVLRKRCAYELPPPTNDIEEEIKAYLTENGMVNPLIKRKLKPFREDYRRAAEDFMKYDMYKEACYHLLLGGFYEEAKSIIIKKRVSSKIFTRFFSEDDPFRSYVEALYLFSIGEYEASLRILKSIKNKKLANPLIAEIYYKIGRFDLAFFYSTRCRDPLCKIIKARIQWRWGKFQDALETLKNIPDEFMSERLLCEADILAEQGFTEESIRKYLKAISNLKDSQLLALAYNNLGDTYRYFGNYISAMECFHKALEYAITSGDNRLYCWSMLNLADCYAEYLKDAETASMYLKIVEYYAHENEIFAEYLFWVKGIIERIKGKKKMARKYLNIAKKFAREKRLLLDLSKIMKDMEATE